MQCYRVFENSVGVKSPFFTAEVDRLLLAIFRSKSLLYSKEPWDPQIPEAWLQAPGSLLVSQETGKYVFQQRQANGKKLLVY